MENLERAAAAAAVAATATDTAAALNDGRRRWRSHFWGRSTTKGKRGWWLEICFYCIIISILAAMFIVSNVSNASRILACGITALIFSYAFARRVMRRAPTQRVQETRRPFMMSTPQQQSGKGIPAEELQYYLDWLDAAQQSAFQHHELPKRGSDGCIICLQDYSAEGEQVPIKLSSCNHHFHRACIGQWLLNHSSCPLCNVDVSSVIRSIWRQSTDDNESKLSLQNNDIKYWQW